MNIPENHSVKLFAWFIAPLALAALALAACTTAMPVTPPLARKPLPTLTVTSPSIPVPVPDTPILTLTASDTPSPLPPKTTEIPTFIPLIATQTPTPRRSLTPPLPTPTQGAQLHSGSETPTSPPTSTHIPTFTPTPGLALSPPLPTPSEQPTNGTEALTPTLVLPTDPPDAESEDESTHADYRYLPLGPAQPDLSQPCPGCPRAPGYIVGRVIDAGGVPLAGVRLVCYNDWHRYPVVGTKGGGDYDFPILQAEATWYVVVLDEADQPVSPEVPVYFNPLEACWYRLGWQRID